MPLRTLNPGLKKQAADRTNTAVASLFETTERLWREMHAPEFKFDRTEPMTMAEAQVAAGLNEKFVYGKKHKTLPEVPSAGGLSTRDKLDKWVQEYNTEYEKLCAKSARDDGPVDDAAYWRERYEKLARHANLWHARMRQMRKRLRDLGEDPEKVVPLVKSRK
jgi:hypothetical protein